MRRLSIMVSLFCVVGIVGQALGTKGAKPNKGHTIDGVYERTRSDFPGSGSNFGVAQAGTTWIGADATGTSVVAGGVWDFDNRSSIFCPDDYIKNGAFSQGWTSENPYAQRDLYWHAENFSDPGLSCSTGPVGGSYSAWCGVVSPGPAEYYHCWNDAPGYGDAWDQWICMTVPFAASNSSLSYTFRADVEAGYDYAYVILDTEDIYGCGWASGLADTLRCYTGPIANSTEYFDLSNVLSNPNLCDSDTRASYDGVNTRLCFVVIEDGSLNDEDGGYTTCDGAFTVDNVIVETNAGPHRIDFESGTLEDFTPCRGSHSGDYTAIRSVGSFTNNGVCGFANCDMIDCVLTFFDPDRNGEYGRGGHPDVPRHVNRAWSPVIDLTAYPRRGYLIEFDMYGDHDFTRTGIVHGIAVNYAVPGACPTGPWSGPLNTQNWLSGPSEPECAKWTYDISTLVPADAESLRVSLGVFNWGCDIGPTCSEGNESPIFDNVRLGIYPREAPIAWMMCEYNDAFPEAEELGPFPSTQPALVDAAWDLGVGDFLRLGDTMVVATNDPDAVVDLCFRIVPGPGTNLADDFFAWWFPGEHAPCVLSGVYCARMDTAFQAGNGISGDPHEWQRVMKGFYCSTFHESDGRYLGEGIEIFPDSLFTPGTKIYYAIGTFFESGGPTYLIPRGADFDDPSTLYEYTVLPDQCKDPLACLLYVDYYNRGAQPFIEGALELLGRHCDRFDKERETSMMGNGIGNRILGAGKYRLRGPIGPSIWHLGQYKVMLVNNGDLSLSFSDGGTSVSYDPTDDMELLGSWLHEGTPRGLWLSGDNIASEFADAGSGLKPLFLSDELGADVVSESYRELTGHPHFESCRALRARNFEMAVQNEYSTLDMLSLMGSGCPQMYDYDVLDQSGATSGYMNRALMYDLSGYYASVDHVYTATNAPFDTIRTKIDGFSVHKLRMNDPPCEPNNNVMTAVWIRDALGGQGNKGYFYDQAVSVQYCPPIGPEDPVLDVPQDPVRAHSNALFQNYPNPFRGGSGTTIHYTAAKAGAVEVRVYDCAGRLIAVLPDEAEPGDNFVVWDGFADDGHRAASGVYFYRMKAGPFSSHKKMLLIR